MKKLNYSILIVIMLLITSCNNSIYIYDPIDPRLPIYSETGNNVAGAFINEKLWRSQVANNNSNDKPRITFNKTTKRLAFYFRGTSDVYDKIIITIQSDDTIENIKDLTKLDGKKVAINGTNNIGYVIRNNTSKETELTPNTSTGQFYIKNATYGVDGNGSYIIISGTFGFNVDTENGNVKIHYGRFDYKIDEDSLWIREN